MFSERHGKIAVIKESLHLIFRDESRPGWSPHLNIFVVSGLEILHLILGVSVVVANNWNNTISLIN
jgi:hypothetical protein